MTMRIPKLRIPVQLLAILLLFWILVVALMLISMRRNDGHLIYPLDDAYIHMSIAKNVVQHGVWGVTPHAFTSSSSSYLWTLLLSLSYILTGVNHTAPFALNLLFGSLLLLVVWRSLKAFLLPDWYTTVALALLILVTPLVPLIFGGMEHTLHTLLFLIFVTLVSRELGPHPSAPWRSAEPWIYALTPLLVLTRFESLAVVAVTALLFLLRRRLPAAVAIAATAVVTVLIPGLLSKTNGGFLLPNSVLLKSDVPLLPTDLNALLITLLRVPVMIARYPYLGSAILIAGILYLWRARRLDAPVWDQRQILLLTFIASTLLHLQYGQCGWLYRYEAYLVAFGIFVVMAGGYEFFTPARQTIPASRPILRKRLISAQILVAAILVTGCIPFSYKVGTPPTIIPVDVPNLFGRIVLSLKDLACQTTNIYQQHVQMARFLHRYYDTACVIANDIGAITYFTNIHLIDLVGLGSTDIAKLRLDGHFDPRSIQQVATAKQAHIAILYADSFRDYIPPSWLPIGQWQIHDNRICAGDTITFFAVTDNAANLLRHNLQLFSSQLPQTPTPVDWRPLW